MRRGLIALALAAWPLGGCAYLLGHAEAPQPPAPFEAEAATVRAETAALAVAATFLGGGERIVSSRNWVGRAGTVVNPYGEDALAFRVEVTNRGSEPVVLLPHEATLAFADRAPGRALTLEDYRARWPLWAIRTAEDREHRTRAYAHVLDTMLIERRLRPGEKAEGRLAFASAPPRDPMTLALPYMAGLERRALTLTWRLL